ncbi:hypothetical protein OC846_005714 [Tilletia horrida]|uniref:Rab proteins geranylgeranyltransferase component A n=1 Tax=Tilletia horrida TaxID=155126 RepID=A0AAN6GMU2_9BASI|nr:hypothetical protein OC846_005714 [Tilletia horrida]KAK0561379.1 hypothetical protein OC861_005847 [Tilletia horrida]
MSEQQQQQQQSQPTLDLEKTHYDAVIVGTGLTESILAAALASVGRQVLHIDQNSWYGGRTWASLSLKELVQWSQESSPYKDERYKTSLTFPAFEQQGQGAAATENAKEIPSELLPLDRHYALSLCPTLLPASGLTIDILIRSGVASYCTFRLLENTLVYHQMTTSGPDTPSSAALKRVPSSKEDIFKDRSISLPDKRRLMKVLQEVAAATSASSVTSTSLPQSTDHASTSAQPFLDFLQAPPQNLSPDMSSLLTYGIALAATSAESTPYAQSKMATHLQSLGRYGTGGAYLVGQYGGSGELAQGFCRCAAVLGSTYILGREVKEVKRLQQRQPDSNSQSAPFPLPSWSVNIDGTEVTTDWLVLDQEASDRFSSASPQAAAAEEDGHDIVFGQIVLNRPFRLSSEPASTSTGAEAGTNADKTSDPEQKTPASASPPETALVVFPPDHAVSVEGKDKPQMSTFVLMNGEGTFSTPKGQYVYYLLTSVDRQDQRPASDILKISRDRVLQLTEGAKEEWKLSQQDDETTSETPLAPILEAYHRRRIPRAELHSAGAEQFEDGAERHHRIDVPFPPPPSQAGPTSSSVASEVRLPGLSTTLDSATSLAGELFWKIGGGASAKAKAEQARSRRKKKERDEEEFAGRAVALAGVRDAEGQQDEQEEEEDKDVWEFFPKRERNQDED